MKKLLNITLLAGLTLAVSGCADNAKVDDMAGKAKAEATKSVAAAAAPSINDVKSMNVNEVCSVEKQGLAKVMATAKLYNAVAKKEVVEFKRLGTTASQYITLTEEAIASKAKNVDIYEFKKGKKTKKTATLTVDYAAWRSCSFAIAALQQKLEAKDTWQAGVPGYEGYVKN
jgi:hypothetical protein